jgi:ribosome-associated protein
MSDLNLPKNLAKAATAKKASNIRIIDVTGKSDLCEYMVICSGESDRQTQAIAREVDRVARKELGIKPGNIEGMQSGSWILLDFGSTMVHIFQSETRNYYALDTLWPDASEIDFNA